MIRRPVTRVRCRPRAARRGVTLWHVIVYIFGLSVIMSVLGVLLQRVGSLRRDTTSASTREQALERLQRDLRRDAHWATAATADLPTKSLTFHVRTNDDVQTVQYQASPRRLQREARVADRVVAREEYALHDLIDMVPQADLAQSRASVTLWLGPAQIYLPLDLGRYVREDLQP